MPGPSGIISSDVVWQLRQWVRSARSLAVERQWASASYRVLAGSSCGNRRVHTCRCPSCLHEACKRASLRQRLLAFPVSGSARLLWPSRLVVGGGVASIYCRDLVGISWHGLFLALGDQRRMPCSRQCWGNTARCETGATCLIHVLAGYALGPPHGVRLWVCAALAANFPIGAWACMCGPLVAHCLATHTPHDRVMCHPSLDRSRLWQACETGCDSSGALHRSVACLAVHSASPAWRREGQRTPQRSRKMLCRAGSRG